MADEPMNTKPLEWKEVKKEEMKIISRRRGNDDPPDEHLIGLALSGGGIRSATFALGVTESLRSKGLLKQVDYLSSVSGGGYLAAWLVANCQRAQSRTDGSKDWLDNGADWSDSIRHLRQYSNYLSPQLGFLSADTWVMATIWFRNTILVQTILVLAIALLLLLPKPLFQLFFTGRTWGYWVIAFLYVIATFSIAANLCKMGGKFKCLDKINFTQGAVQFAIVIPLIGTAYGVTAILWDQSVTIYQHDGCTTFKQLLSEAYKDWQWQWVVFSLLVFAVSTIRLGCEKGENFRWARLLTLLTATVAATAVLYILLCTIMLIFFNQTNDIQLGHWFSFVWGAPMVILSFGLSIIMLIGIMGRDCREGLREWWSRIGALLCINGMVWVLIVAAAVYGPLLITMLWELGQQKLVPLLTWLGTTLISLLAGKSGATGSTHPGQNPRVLKKILNIVALVGPFLFMGGLLLFISAAVHEILLNLNKGNSCDDACQPSLDYWTEMSLTTQGCSWVMALLAILVLLSIMAARVDINEFSLNAFYRSRLARCYLGATRFGKGERKPQKFTGFDEKDDMKFEDLGKTDPPRAPLHIVNCALNLGGSNDLSLHTRHSASFTFTPYHAGSGYLSRVDEENLRNLSRVSDENRMEMGYCELSHYGDSKAHPTLAQVISVSGAAASPNRGYHTSPRVAFMLTVFNLRLGWWFPNPLRIGLMSSSPTFWLNLSLKWSNSFSKRLGGLYYLGAELFGQANEKSSYLMLSDGGHFENLAAYELIRRECRVIIISDAECDPDMQFESLGNLIRICEVDLNVKIDINVDALRPCADGKGLSRSHYAVGEIVYPNSSFKGILIYLKASMTGNEDASIRQYKDSHPDFPQESTGNQFYGEDQFESYRRLGKEVAESAFGGGVLNEPIEEVAEKLLAAYQRGERRLSS